MRIRGFDFFVVSFSTFLTARFFFIETGCGVGCKANRGLCCWVGGGLKRDGGYWVCFQTR
jgi:hypothetical protein